MRKIIVNRSQIMNFRNWIHKNIVQRNFMALHSVSLAAIKGSFQIWTCHNHTNVEWTCMYHLSPFTPLYHKVFTSTCIAIWGHRTLPLMAGLRPSCWRLVFTKEIHYQSLSLTLYWIYMYMYTCTWICLKICRSVKSLYVLQYADDTCLVSDWLAFCCAMLDNR